MPASVNRSFSARMPRGAATPEVRASGCARTSSRLLDELADDPVARLRARLLHLGDWVRRHPGLFKVLHESTLNQRAAMEFKQEPGERTTAAVRRCMDAGLAAPGDAAEVSLDLRAAVHGAVSMRVNQPDLPWPPLEEQFDRFLIKLAGIAPASLRQGL